MDVYLDRAGIKSKAGVRIKRAQMALDVQILKDSNYFCPDAEGTLMRSGVVASGGGEVRWETSYAKRQYNFFPNKGKDKNPNASMKWYERAKAWRGKEWQELVNREYNK